MVGKVTSIVIYVTIVSALIVPPTKTTAVVYVMFQAELIASLTEGVNVTTIGDVNNGHPLTFQHTSGVTTADNVGITVTPVSVRMITIGEKTTISARNVNQQTLTPG